jgi:ABC-type Fe3+ transport system substrate-binding protein
MSLIKGGKEQVAAKKLYDWVLSSKSAQQVFIKWYLVLVAKGAPVHPNALSLDDINAVEQDMLWDGDKANKDRLLKRWTDEIGSLKK